MAGPEDLERIAVSLESLGDVCSMAVIQMVPEVRTALAKMGRAGGPMRQGNAVTLRVSADGTTLTVHAVYPSDKSVQSWLRWLRKRVAEVAGTITTARLPK